MSFRVVAVALCLFTAVPASGATLDEHLAATEPCRELPQINETEEVTLEHATISVLPATAEMTVAGRIACRSGAGAILTSDASARLEARVALDLAGCAATEAEVRLTEFDGSLGGLVEALAEQLQAALAEDIASAAEDACRDLLYED